LPSAGRLRTAGDSGGDPNAIVESAEVGLDTPELFGDIGVLVLESPRPWLDVLGNFDVDAGGDLKTISEEEVEVEVVLAFLDLWS
jgi:hypothetical protein